MIYNESFESEKTLTGTFYLDNGLQLVFLYKKQRPASGSTNRKFHHEITRSHVT